MGKTEDKAAARIEGELEVAAAVLGRPTAQALQVREKRQRKAAHLRARGASWDEVAQVIGRRGKRPANSARSYCTGDRHLWAKLMRDACDDLLADEIEPEALKTQRELMSLKDSGEVKEKDVAARSADSILRYLASIRRKELLIGQVAAEGSDEELIEKLKVSANAAAQQVAREQAARGLLPEGRSEGEGSDGGAESEDSEAAGL